MEKQVNLGEFKTSLDYRGSLAKAILHGETLSQKSQNKQTKKNPREPSQTEEESE